MPPIKDLTGQRFGRLVAVKPTDERAGGSIVWECECDCGIVCSVSRKLLVGGSTKSCGCRKIDASRETGKKHGKLYGKNNVNLAHKTLKDKELKDGTSLCTLTAKTYSNNTSGVKGVCFHSRDKKWYARIQLGGEIKYLGTFKKKEDAIKARKLAEEKYFEPILNKYGRTLYKED